METLNRDVTHTKDELEKVKGHNSALLSELESVKTSLYSVREELDRKEKKAERDMEEIKTANKDKDHRFGSDVGLTVAFLPKLLRQPQSSSSVRVRQEIADREAFLRSCMDLLYTSLC